MPLPLALVFHFNQHTNENTDTANRACYRGLLNVLRGHPKLKFNLHFSGTLLRALPWFDSETMALVRAGLAAGQFELLGSTYAQNVPYASDDWDNEQQIALHRQVLADLFGVTPSAFWISERSWRQSLAPVIAAGGYRVVPVEDHMLRAAGLEKPVPAAISAGEQSLTMVWDDTVLRDRLNFAAWFGRKTQLFKYLQQWAAQPEAEDSLLVYAEDAEAMGLWGWEKGYLPQATWAQLDNVLTELENNEAYVLQHLSAARARQTLESLPDAAAQWMNVALLRPDAPYHEDGYSNWFDFLARAPKVARFRRLYATLRARLQALEEARAAGQNGKATGGGDQFYRQAVEAFCHHQYEFGCIGVGGPGYWGWENVRATFALAMAAELADAPRTGQWVDDVNGDGSDEQLLCNGRELAVLTSYGGRLLYWLDLETGREWVGNQLAVPQARFDVDAAAKLPKLRLRPARWLPETYTANIRPWNTLKHKEAAPTRMGRHLPLWILEGEPAELNVVALPEAEGGQRLALAAQTGALGEVVQIDATPPGASDALLDYRFEDGGITYLLFPAPDVYIEKRVTQELEGLHVRYAIENRDEVAHDVQIRVEHELAPDYAQALPVGRGAYAYAMHAGRWPAVRNTVTGTAVVVETEPAGAAACEAQLLALRLSVTVRCPVAARSQGEVEVRLRRVAEKKEKEEK
jgi:hypothetical protein